MMTLYSFSERGLRVAVVVLMTQTCTVWDIKPWQSASWVFFPNTDNIQVPPFIFRGIFMSKSR